MANKQKQMLAVWGSPGAGKTVTAVKLAAELAKRKKNVVLVFTDVTAPPRSPLWRRRANCRRCPWAICCPLPA